HDRRSSRGNSDRHRLRRAWLRLHDLRRLAELAKEVPSLAHGTHLHLDARTPVAGTCQLPAHFFPLRVLLWQGHPHLVDDAEFYDKEVRPYLEKEGGKGCAIAARDSSIAMFANLKTLLPEVIHSVVVNLENICEEKRQLDHQVRMHRVLHGWLFIHVPLSLA